MSIDLIYIIALAVGASGVSAGLLQALKQLYVAKQSRSSNRKLQQALSLVEEKDELIQDYVSWILELENKDARMAFIRLMVNIESGLRKVARRMELEPEKLPLSSLLATFIKKRIITDKMRSSIQEMWEMRNKTVHGEDIRDAEMKRSLFLGAAIMLALKQTWPDYFRDAGEMGIVYQTKGELDKAMEYYGQALKIHREIGHREGEASALANMGIVYRMKGELDTALQYHQQALRIDREIGNREGEDSDLSNMGIVYRMRGELDKALEHYQQALKIDREIGHREGAANALGNMGNVYGMKGELDKALEYHQQALKIDREIGIREGEARDLGNMGNVYQEKGELDKALEYHQQALEIFEEIGAKEGVEIARENISKLRPGRPKEGRSVRGKGNLRGVKPK